jgi:WD40 repeat protein
MQLTKHWAAVLEDYVIDLAWSGDGALLAAAAGCGPIAIFDREKGTKHHDLPGHEDGTNAISWAPGRTSLLASGGQDGCVKLWDGTAGQHVATAKLGSAWVEHVAWRPLRRPPAAQGAADDASSTPGAAPDDSTSISAHTQSRAGDLCLAAAAGKQLVFVNADGSVRHTFKPAPKTLSALAWQPAGGCIAAAYFGGVCLWDADDHIAQKEYAYGNGIHALVWSPDNKWLVSGNQDPSVHLWIPETDVELHMSGYEGKVKELSYDHTSRWLATGGGKDACLWDCSGAGPEGREPQMLPHDAKVCAVAFQHKHGLLATASQDGAVMLWSPERRQPLRATIRMPHPATKLVWSPDDRLLAIGSEHGAVYVLKCEQ